MAKKTNYNPDAHDGDDLIQDDTEFEAVADTDLEEPAAEGPEIQEAAPEALEVPLEATKPVLQAKTYTAQNGDSYASLAARFVPAGWRKHTYALYLHEKNGGKSIKDGTVIHL